MQVDEEDGWWREAGVSVHSPRFEYNLMGRDFSPKCPFLKRWIKQESPC